MRSFLVGQQGSIGCILVGQQGSIGSILVGQQGWMDLFSIECKTLYRYTSDINTKYIK